MYVWFNIRSCFNVVARRRIIALIWMYIHCIWLKMYLNKYPLIQMIWVPSHQQVIYGTSNCRWKNSFALIEIITELALQNLVFVACAKIIHRSNNAKKGILFGFDSNQSWQASHKLQCNGPQARPQTKTCCGWGSWMAIRRFFGRESVLLFIYFARIMDLPPDVIGKSGIIVHEGIE